MTRRKDTPQPKKRTRAAARKDLERAAQPMARKPKGGTGEQVGPYRATPAGLTFSKSTRNGDLELALTNFTARITEERTRDDGLSTETVFIVEGHHANGRPLAPAEVPAAQFPALSWISRHWGATCIVYAGQSIRDHVRVAIQVLSGEPRRQTVYLHTGWRTIDGAWRYLHAGGALGADGNDPGIAVALDGELSRYELPEPPGGKNLARAIRASLALRDLTADGVLGWVLLAAVYRAPTSDAHRVDLSVFVAGPTGTAKTETTALAQAHYGEFDARSLPAGWTDTAGALEQKAHAAKDAILTVDDYKPTGSGVDVQRLAAKADNVIRAQGNRIGRARLRADLTARPAFVPRGLIVSSGEDIPPGESLRARTLTHELRPGDVDLEALTEIQDTARAGELRAAMAGYIRWLTGRMDDLRREMPIRARALRDTWRAEIGTGHARAPDNAASLWLGIELLMEYATDGGALTPEAAEALTGEARAALLAAMRKQADITSDEKEADRFVALLRGLLVGGRGHLKDGETHREPATMAHLYGWRSAKNATGDDIWCPLGDTLGWVQFPELWLDPENVLAAVQTFGRHQGRPIEMGARSLWGRLADAGYIVTGRDGETTRRTQMREIAGRRRRVLVMPCDVLDAHPDNSPRPSRPDAPQGLADDAPGSGPP